MVTHLRVTLIDAEATARFGALLAQALFAGRDEGGGRVGLSGDLGSGKTALARGVLRALGVNGPVRSPTYTLVEPYELPAGVAFHLDLYRLSNPKEVEFLGVRDLPPTALVLVEWPENGGDQLPGPDLHIELTEPGDGRLAVVSADSPRGERVLQHLESLLAQVSYLTSTHTPSPLV